MTLKPVKTETNYDQTEAGMQKTRVKKKKKKNILLLKRKGPSKYTIKKTFF